MTRRTGNDKGGNGAVTSRQRRWGSGLGCKNGGVATTYLKHGQLRREVSRMDKNFSRVLAAAVVRFFERYMKKIEEYMLSQGQKSLF